MPADWWLRTWRTGLTALKYASGLVAAHVADWSHGAQICQRTGGCARGGLVSRRSNTPADWWLRTWRTGLTALKYASGLVAAHVADWSHGAQIRQRTGGCARGGPVSRRSNTPADWWLRTLRTGLTALKYAGGLVAAHVADRSHGLYSGFRISGIRNR